LTLGGGVRNALSSQATLTPHWDVYIGGEE